MSIEADVQKFAPGQKVELFELDATALGGSVFRWHNGVNELGSDVVWDGNTYVRFPVIAAGFQKSAKGVIARPTLRVGNVNGVLGGICKTLDDLIGAKVTRRRTLVKYLDAVNFTGGVNPTADPNCGFPDEIWSIDRKAGQNGVFVEFELAAAHDVAGKKLPGRQAIQNVCPWGYKSAECGYSGGPVADINDNLTSDPDLDNCGKRLTSCKLRFGNYGELPFGGFPGVGLVR